MIQVVRSISQKMMNGIFQTQSFCSDSSSVVSPNWQPIEFDEDDEIVHTESPGMHTSTLL